MFDRAYDPFKISYRIYFTGSSYVVLIKMNLKCKKEKWK